MARLVDPRDEAPIDPTPVRAGDAAIDCGVLGELMLRWWYDQFILASVHDERYVLLSFSRKIFEGWRAGELGLGDSFLHPRCMSHKLIPGILLLR